MLSPKVNHRPLTLADFSPKMRESLASLGLESLSLSEYELQQAYLFDQGKISGEEYQKRVLQHIIS